MRLALTRAGVAARVALVAATLASLLTPARAGAASGGWVASGPPGGGVQALAIGAGAPDRIWAGTIYSNYTEPKPGQASVSRDGGQTWSDVPGIRIQPIGSFAVDPTDSDVVYAGADCNTCPGVFKTTDGGHHWVLTSLGRRFVKAIAVDPSNPETLYVGTLIEGAFKSVDGGATWAPANIGLGGNPVFSMVVDPSTDRRSWPARGTTERTGRPTAGRTGPPPEMGSATNRSTRWWPTRRSRGDSWPAEPTACT